MRKIIHITIILIFVSSAVIAASGDVQLLKQARSQIKVIAGELQLKVARAVQEKGEENALASCRLQVTGITDRLSLHSGWEIRRTSFKVRNLNNLPDPWEEDVLRLFEQRLAEGVAPESFEFAKVFGGQLRVRQRFWVYVGDLEDNPDIADYRGYGQVQLA